MSMTINCDWDYICVRGQQSSPRCGHIKVMPAGRLLIEELTQERERERGTVTETGDIEGERTRTKNQIQNANA